MRIPTYNLVDRFVDKVSSGSCTFMSQQGWLFKGAMCLEGCNLWILHLSCLVPLDTVLFLRRRVSIMMVATAEAFEGRDSLSVAPVFLTRFDWAIEMLSRRDLVLHWLTA